MPQTSDSTAEGDIDKERSARGSFLILAEGAFCYALRVVKPRSILTLDTHALLQLVERAKALNASLTQGEVLKLKCPCGASILSPTPAIASLKDRQRGLLKSKIEHHLRDRHEMPERRIRDVLRESFV
jgi:hypothetical protein